MNASNNRVFYYHADATPLGGFITEPYDHILQPNTSVSLGQAGGHAMGRAEQFHVDKLIRTGPHYAHVTGSVHTTRSTWVTEVTSTVEHLDILNGLVTADKISSKIVIENRQAAGAYYPSVNFAACTYENLKIEGRKVEAPVDETLVSGHTVSEQDKLSAEPAPNRIEYPDTPWTQETGFVNRAIAQSKNILAKKGSPSWLSSRFDWIASPEERSKRGYVLASLVNEVHGLPEGSSFGHVIHIPKLGNVFLGELIVTPVSFNLTMLRAEMGCDAEGNLCVASSRGGSFPMP